MRILIILGLLLCGSFVFGQHHIHLDTLRSKSDDLVIVNKIAGDSLTSSFVITIKKSVKKHLHKEHSETIYVLEGEGKMLLGEQIIQLKKGDYIFIPKNTPHKVDVTSSFPLKVLSIQSPYFDGKDRLMLE
jgi:quercetin dioxygenase-like cupin family protein